MQKNMNKDHLREEKECKGVSSSLKKLIKGYFEEKYLWHLKNNCAWFMNVFVRQVFVIDLDLQQNEEIMRQLCNKEQII